MNGLCDKFFSGAALARHQNCAVGCAYYLDHLEEFLHGGALADHAAQAMSLFEFPTKVRVLFPQSPVLEGVTNDHLQLLEIVLCLKDVVEGAHLQGLDRRIGARECREKNELAVKAVG